MDRLRQRADFLAVANGARANSVAFVVQARRRDDDGPVRVGFTVTRKNGTATERNRIRRRLRELVKRLDVISMRPHSDYVLVGRRAALTCDFATMLDDLRSALHRLERQSTRPQPTRPPKADSSEAVTGSRQQHASNKQHSVRRKPN
ncbi:MAG: ribonuclease P protein component [Bradyrhizobium sp.]